MHNEDWTKGISWFSGALGLNSLSQKKSYCSNERDQLDLVGIKLMDSCNVTFDSWMRKITTNSKNFFYKINYLLLTI